MNFELIRGATAIIASVVTATATTSLAILIPGFGSCHGISDGLVVREAFVLAAELEFVFHNKIANSIQTIFSFANTRGVRQVQFDVSSVTGSIPVEYHARIH